MSVNVHQAKTNLSKLLVQVEAGEEIVISRAGRPVARLVPYVEARPARRPGRWAGRIRIASDFDQTPDDIIDSFETGSMFPPSPPSDSSRDHS